MNGFKECPTIPAMSSVSEAEYRRDIERGMSITDERTRRDTQRRIKALAEKGDR